MPKPGSKSYSQVPSTSKDANKGQVTRNRSTSSRKPYSKTPKQAKK